MRQPVDIQVITIAVLIVICLAVAGVRGVLRLQNGQIQEQQEDGSWKCANDEIRKICWHTNITHTDIQDFARSIEALEIIEAYDDAAIRQLAESGRICEVMGHMWQLYDCTYRPNVVADEKCGLCGEVRELTATWNKE